MTTPTKNPDVVVVGAGPVGLVTACELARRGVSIRIVDKLSGSPSFEGHADREQVEAALERIAHRMLVQRGWDDDRALAAAAG